MNYATYAQYVEEYGGSLISEDVFKRMILKASRYIDYFTDYKITQYNINNYPELVMCACEIVDAICNHSDANGRTKEKKSENTDGYSVTYVTESVDGTLVDSMLKRKAYEIARVHLMNTGLLYLGID